MKFLLFKESNDLNFDQNYIKNDNIYSLHLKVLDLIELKVCPKILDTDFPMHLYVLSITFLFS